MSKVIIMVGGPRKGTRFRPLSLSELKPLFPLAGTPMLEHHIQAAKALPDLIEVILLGFYKKEVLEKFITAVSSSLDLKIRYLKETQKFGNAGGLLHFKNQILEGAPKRLFVIHVDIICPVKLTDLAKHHDDNDGLVTMVVAQVPKEHAQKYGCVILDDKSNVEHYRPRPDTFLSDWINTGVYCTKPEIFAMIKEAKDKGPIRSDLMLSYESIFSTETESLVQWEEDVLMPLTGTGKLKYLKTPAMGRWRQIKNAGAALYANNIYLERLRTEAPEKLSKLAQVIGSVVIHPSAVVHKTAKIGPNVSIGPGAVVGAGVRVSHAIIRANSLIKANAFVKTAVVDKDVQIGQWARVEGIINDTPFLYANSMTKKRVGVTIIGAGAKVKPEILVYNCVVMPHKGISSDTRDRIVL